MPRRPMIFIYLHAEAEGEGRGTRDEEQHDWMTYREWSAFQ